MKISALQQAVYNRLSGYSALTALVTGVYSRVSQPDSPEDASLFPYVTIGMVSALPWDTDDKRGVRAIIQAHVWSRSGSDLERRNIEGEVYNALHRYDLTIAGATTVDCLFDGQTEMADPDGITTHGVVSFAITYDSI